MSDLKRHIGRVTNTGARIVVVFRKIPGDDGNCLVIESDRLPEMYHDNIMTIINSREAQDTVDLYNVLHRRTFADGRNCLQTLHETNLLRKVPVNLVEMMPYPNTPVALDLVNNEIDGATTATEDAPSSEISRATVEPPVAATKEPVAVTGDEADQKAEALVARALIMEETAAALKEEAYMLVPKLRPGKGRPRLTEAEAAIKKEERNARRRAKYQSEKAAEAAKAKAKKKS